ncbi:MAG TPA: ATP/GTP-binding protein [Nocardioidaceae bacterium]
MDFAPTSAPRKAASTKIVIAGGFGVGKTTLVGSVSEIVPLRTEALVTNESEGVDDLGAVPTKATTTVAMDFGRLTLAEDLVLYLFGTPGQRRFWFMWDDLCRGAIGAIVLVDTARLDESFSPLDYFESKGLPFIVGVNHFDGTKDYDLDEVAAALALPPEVPIMRVDPRRRESAKEALVRVTEYALLRLTQSLTVNAN